ncbi:MAG TPA: GNAT family N-acetyltransferase [Candidatus Limnocylindrales bacterium]|nr:GNAT family N-acetyltransferase [Candidatus Limnocylindrales bacterium]
MTDASDDVLLQTERLSLRRLTPADVDALVELDSDPEVTFFVTGGPPEFAAPMLDAWLHEYARWRGYGTFAAIERASGEFVGWFHLRPEAGHDDQPELGYRLRRSAWGRGLATEGSRALIDFAFRDLGASRVWAEAMSVNAASRRVMEKAGMRQVRTFHAEWPYRIPGDEQGDVEYEVTRADWDATR